MKTFLLLASVLCLTVAAGIVAATPQGKETKAYACEKCHVASMKSGKCACGAEKMAVNGRVAYVCTHCNKSSKTASDCKSCGMKMQKSLITYACEGCKVSSAKPGECKMCKGALKKYVLPMQ